MAILLVTVTLGSSSANAYAFSDGSGWAMFPYVVQQLYEAYKRYAQLQLLIAQGQAELQYLRIVNAGLDNITGLIRTLPIKDEKILAHLKDFQRAIESIAVIYGTIPHSGESQMQTIHDQTVAESFKLTNSIQEYAENQEANAEHAFAMAGQMSPKGAVRLAASTQAQILHTLTQLLRVNGELLKIHGEQLALNNKEGKDSVGHFNKVNTDVKSLLNKFSGDLNIPKF